MTRDIGGGKAATLARSHAPYLPLVFIMQSKVKILGFSWHGTNGAKYINKHRWWLEKAGYDMSVTHLAVQVDDWVYHVFTGAKPGNTKKSYWISRKVSDRAFKKPLIELDLGDSDFSPSFAMGLTADIRTPVWGQYVWFYSFFLLKVKRDCVSTTKKLITYLKPGIPKLKSQTPYSLLKELENNGYRSP